MIQPSIFAALGRNWQLVADAAVDGMLNALNGGVVIRAQDGRELTRVSVPDAQRIYEFAMDQLQAGAAPNDGGIILADFGQSGSGGNRGGGYGW